MSPSKVANATLRRAAAAVPVFALLFACSEKEWDEKPGTLELYAAPLPPVAGQALTLGVLGTNVGPVDVFQGDQRIASLVNVDTTKRAEFQVIAVSSAVPTAVAVAYDFKRLEAQAKPFTTQPSVPDGGLVDAGPRDAGVRDAGAPDVGAVDAAPAFVEDCPGLVSVPSPDVCTPYRPGNVELIVRNERPSTVVAVALSNVDGGPCRESTLTPDFPANRTVTAYPWSGMVVEFRSAGSATALRRVQLPAAGTCKLLFTP
jgi:hypothetical protein